MSGRRRRSRGQGDVRVGGLVGIGRKNRGPLIKTNPPHPVSTGSPAIHPAGGHYSPRGNSQWPVLSRQLKSLLAFGKANGERVKRARENEGGK